MKTKDLLELKKRLSYIVDHLDPFAPGTLNPTMRHALAEFDLEKELNDPFGFTHKTLVWFDLMDTELKSRQYFEND